MGSAMKYLELLKNSLAPVAQESALAEAETILKHVLACTRSDLYLASHSTLDREKTSCIDAIVKRRLTGEPLPYVLGKAHFYSLELTVNPDVLIPRPETEVLVEIILKNEQEPHCKFIDVGIGSGAIAAALCDNRISWQGLGIDISCKALSTARKNCGVNASLICCDMLSSFKHIGASSQGFDFIASNPPYIAENEFADLDKSVLLFEPKLALYGGIDGLDFYRILAREGKRIIKPGGRIYCEIGFSQGEKTADILKNNGWGNVRVFNDLANRPRVVTAHLNNVI
jgi:release factor glutamine methyltransferase